MVPLTYRIEVRGRLPSQVLDELADFTVDISVQTTTLSGPFADSAALYGLITRLEALGLALVSVQPADRRDQHDQPDERS